MKKFENKKHKEYTVIVGCGRLGANIANTLSDKEDNVLIMDTSKDAFNRLNSAFGGLSVVGDGTDFDALRDANIDKATTVIAVTDNDNTNIMVAQIAKEVYGVDKVIARLYEHERECVYKELGISTICPSVLSVNEVDKLLNTLDSEIEEVGA